MEQFSKLQYDEILGRYPITPSKYGQSQDNPLTMSWFNLTPKLCHLVQFTFYLSMRKRSLELKFCRMITDIITYFSNIYQEFLSLL